MDLTPHRTYSDVLDQAKVKNCEILHAVRHVAVSPRIFVIIAEPVYVHLVTVFIIVLIKPTNDKKRVNSSSLLYTHLRFLMA